MFSSQACVQTNFNSLISFEGLIDFQDFKSFSGQVSGVEGLNLDFGWASVVRHRALRENSMVKFLLDASLPLH
jgi:hypothetical protein